MRWVVCSLLLWAAAAITNSFGGALAIRCAGIWAAPVAVALLSLANILLAPAVWVLTFPLRCCTFGLVSFLVNAVIFYVVARLVPGLEVASFWAALLASVLYSVFCTLALGLLMDGSGGKR